MYTCEHHSRPDNHPKSSCDASTAVFEEVLAKIVGSGGSQPCVLACYC